MHTAQGDCKPLNNAKFENDDISIYKSFEESKSEEEIINPALLHLKSVNVSTKPLKYWVIKKKSNLRLATSFDGIISGENQIGDKI